MFRAKDISAGRANGERMASKKTVNAKNLEALGAPRLAALLIEAGERDSAFKRRLRLELAAAESPAAAAAEVRKRLAAVARSRSFLDWQATPALADDLDTHRRAIVEATARADPAQGLELMWRFLALASRVFDRCDDSSGTMGRLFDEAARNLGAIAQAAGPDPAALADDALSALAGTDYGQYHALIPALAPALGREGLERLKQRMKSEPVEALTRRRALMKIADACSDPDLYIAQYDAREKTVPRVAADIALKLLEADRAEEALQALDNAEFRDGSPDEGWPDCGSPDWAWTDARIETFEALGRRDDAQRARLSCFERSLSAEHLRAYLKRLPGFDDVEAEESALDHAETFRDPHAALAFLISWPALDRAAALVLRRAADLDSDDYITLSEAAAALAGRHPLAATLALRAMIGFTLSAARSSRYVYAARDLAECSRLAADIDDFGAFETHDAYADRLRREHGRKYGFWERVSDLEP